MEPYMAAYPNWPKGTVSKTVSTVKGGGSSSLPAAAVVSSVPFRGATI